MLENLEIIQEHINVLDRIGAPWPQQELLAFGQNLIVEALANGETDIGVNAAALIWKIIPETLDLSWHLVKEYFKNDEILHNPSLADLIKFTFNEKWPSVLWILAHIARENDEITWWKHLIPVIRQKAMGTILPKPFQATQSLLTWARTQDFQTLDPTPALEAELAFWSRIGVDLNTSPFDYSAMDLLSDNFNLPRRTRSDIKQVFNAGKESVQNIIKGWQNMDWDVIPSAFRSLLCWDPERWGLITLHENILAFQDWLERLFTGPNSGEAPDAFIGHIRNSRPPIDRVLGRPAWFIRLDSMLTALQEGQEMASLSDEVNFWCPWVLQLGYGSVVEIQPCDSDEYNDKQDS